MLRSLCAVISHCAWLYVVAGDNGSAAQFIVQPGGDLQQAINQAQLGDQVLLDNRGTWTGNYYLTPKSGTGWIDIRALDMSTLPQPGHRVTKSQIAAMPKLISPNFDATISTIGPAHHYRLVGIDVGVKSGTWHWNTVMIGSATEQNLSDLPFEIEMDRMYIHGDQKLGSVRGVAANGRSINIKGSLIENYKRPDYDTQAIAAWNTPGPILIENNQLEGASENIMLGGGIPSIAGMVPSDVIIRRNYIRKPLSWNPSHPTFEGSTWNVKNLFEIKMGRRITFDSNVLENLWQGFQLGFAFVFTVRAEDGYAPQAVVQDVTVTNNIIRNVPCVLNMLGVDDWGSGAGLGRTERVVFSDNIFSEIEEWGCGGRAIQLSHKASVTIDHNTIIKNGGAMLTAAGSPPHELVFTNNIVGFGEYGVAGDGMANGDPVMAYYFPGAVMRRNAFVTKGPTLNSQPDNFWLMSFDEVKFRSLLTGDLLLDNSSPFLSAATDGTAVGADVAKVRRFTARVISGVPPSARF